MTEKKTNDFDFDIETFDATAVLENMRATVEEKGTLDLTELANASVEHSPFLLACKEAVGEDPFAWVMKSSYSELISEIRFKLNSDLLLATLPEQFASAIKAKATLIRSEELGDGNPEFQALKRAICSALTRSILVVTKGRAVLEWDPKFKTDFKFTMHHTSDEKKAEIERRRSERDERGGNRSSADRVTNMRSRFRGNRRG